jgi:hypothetical protein
VDVTNDSSVPGASALRVAAPLERSSLPSLYRAASDTSRIGQQRATRWGGARLILLLVAAFAGGLPWRASVGRVDLLAMGSAVAFVLALVLEVRLGSDNPERRWYRGRAAAESVKTLAWKYAVGGSPFDAGTEPAEADRTLIRQLGDIVRNLRDLELAAVTDRSEQITSTMRKLRGAPLSVRKHVYQDGRVEEQYRWYTARARTNEVKAARWGTVVYAVTTLGVLGALSRAVGLTSMDLLGFASTVVAAATAWSQFRQYRALAAAYALTAQELSLVRTDLAGVQDEASWAAAVSEAEEAISREHTLWLARRDATL